MKGNSPGVLLVDEIFKVILYYLLEHDLMNLCSGLKSISNGFYLVFYYSVGRRSENPK